MVKRIEGSEERARFVLWMPKGLVDKARERAKDLDKNQSRYIADLVLADLSTVKARPAINVDQLRGNW